MLYFFPVEKILFLYAAFVTPLRSNLQNTNLTKNPFYSFTHRSDGIRGNIEVVQLDLTDFASIHKLSKYIMSQEKKLHFLILNAGTFEPYKSETKYGLNILMGSNHYGNVALVEDLLDFMIAQVLLNYVI